VNRGYQRGREVEAKLLRTRAGAEDLAIGGRGRGQAAVCGRDEADKWGLLVSVSQRGEEGEPDDRNPLVSVRVRGGSARSARVGRAGAGRPAGRFPGHSLHSSFSFSFWALFALSLILCIKL